MGRLSRLALILSGVVALATAGCAQRALTTTVPAAQTNTTSHLPGNYLGTRWSPRAAFEPNFGRGTNPESGSFGYNGGPVLTKPRLYLIFWGYRGGDDPDGVKALLVQYAKSVGGSGHDNIYTQYYGPSGHIKNPPSSEKPGSMTPPFLLTQRTNKLRSRHYGSSNALATILTARPSLRPRTITTVSVSARSGARTMVRPSTANE